MPAKSKSQQHLMGMVHAYQKGALKHPPGKIKQVAQHIKPRAAEEFAATKTKKLPAHVKKAELIEYVMQKVSLDLITKNPQELWKTFKNKYSRTGKPNNLEPSKIAELFR